MTTGRTLHSIPFFAFFTFILLTFQSAFGANYSTIADGYWSDPSIWQGGNIPPASINQSDEVLIGHLIDLDADIWLFGQLVISPNKKLVIGQNKSLSIEANGEVIVQGTVSFKEANAVLNVKNSGIITIENGALLESHGVISNAGEININQGGEFLWGPDVNYTNTGSFKLNGDLILNQNNANFYSGNFIWASGAEVLLSGGKTLNLINPLVVPAGAKLKNEGMIESPENLTVNGYLTGSGIFDGDLMLPPNCHFTPGYSTTVMGDFTSEGMFSVQLSGSGSYSQIGHVQVMGDANIHGTVELNLMNNFVPIIGQDFSITTASTISNSATYQYPNVPGIAWNSANMSSNLVIQVTAPPIPTLGEWGVIIFALLLLNWGTIAIRQNKMAVAGHGNTSFNFKVLPFDNFHFKKCLIFTFAGFTFAFILAILFFKYEMTSADIPCSIIAIPLAAYLFHLLRLKN